MKVLLGLVCRNIRLGSLSFLLSVAAVYGPICAITWYFDLPEDFSARIFLNLFSAIVPLSAFLFPPKHWMSVQNARELIGFASFFALILLFLAGNKFNWDILASNAAFVLLVIPYGWWVWKLSERSWFLLSGLFLSFVAMMIYWIAALIKASGPPEFLFLPLLIVAVGGVAWAPIGRCIWNQAKLRKNRRLGGPGWQAAAMAVLFVPVILVAVTFPHMLGLDDIWSAVSLTLVGVLLSAVVSDSLRRFLLEWGNLVPNQNSALYSLLERQYHPRQKEN